MKYNFKLEKGQAIVMIAIAIVGLVGFTALAIDGGNAFSDRRHAQNAADTGVLAAALKKIREPESMTAWKIAGEDIAAINGYDDASPNQEIYIHTCDDETTYPDLICPPPYDGSDATSDILPEEYIHMVIVSHVDTFFAPVVGIAQVTNTVESIARAKPPELVVPFDGAAVVGLCDHSDANQCPIDFGNADWDITGGGVLANSCADKLGPGDITIDSDKCIAGVGGVSSNFDGCVEENQTGLHHDQDEIEAMMPPAPTSCIEVTGANIDSFNDLYENDTYCIPDFDIFDGRDTMLNNATLYVTDTVANENFNIKHNGGSGSFAGTASSSGDYKGFYLIIAMSDTVCDKYNSSYGQVLTMRGNGSVAVTGTILAPTTCIDIRGNAGEEAMDSQIIACKTSSNSSASEIQVHYDPDNNGMLPVPPQIELTR